MNTPLKNAQNLLLELKALLKKYDATIDLESDYESNDCEAFISLNDASFYSAEIKVHSNEITENTNFIVNEFKVQG